MNESFSPKNLMSSKESPLSVDTARRLKVLLAFLTLGSGVAGAQKMDSIPNPQDNLRILNEIITSPNGQKIIKEAEQNHKPFLNFEYRMPMNNISFEQADSMIQEDIKKRKANPNYNVGKTTIHRIDLTVPNKMPEFSDDPVFSEEPEFRFSIGYHVVLENGGNKEVSVDGVDNDGDGTVDKFSITDHEDNGGLLPTKKGRKLMRKLKLQKLKVDHVLDTYDINPDAYKYGDGVPFDPDKHFYLTREKVIEILGQDEGQKVLDQVDKEYHRALEIARGQLIQEAPTHTPQDINNL